MTQICPSCQNNAFAGLIDFGNLPYTGSFLASPEANYPTLGLSFEFCSRCALIRRRISSEESHDYTHVNRNTERQLPHYAPKIVSSLQQWGIGQDDLIVEIGANDGTFLSLVEQAGFTNRLAVEPSLSLADVCKSKGHPVWNAHLDRAEAGKIRQKYGAIPLVFCRHTLEHVPHPQELLLAMRLLLDEGGILFIEVPDTQPILQELKGHELWDEHLHYFTVENLSLLLYRSGFQVEEIQVMPHLSSGNILSWCSKSEAEKENLADFSTCTANVELCRSFPERWSLLRQKLHAQLPNWTKPIVAIGAAHSQSNFLLFTELGEHIDILVDDDPVKVGKYVPLPQPVPVISTAQLLSSSPPGTILRTAFGYDTWMNKICHSLAKMGSQIIEPYSPSHSC
jgi:SAM-dependent methyltransferase